MRGVERVFHVAGMTNLRAHPQALWRANVEGTRVVLEEALRARVARVVYTSSVAAVGPAARGSTADEKQPFPRGAGARAFVRGKRGAGGPGGRVAAARGAPGRARPPDRVRRRGRQP